MADYEADEELEITEVQIAQLRDLGVDDFEDMSMAEAQALIDELQAERDAARSRG